MIQALHPMTPQKNLIEKIATELKQSAVIAYPTDTSYGFGCAIDQRKALNKIDRIKKKSDRKRFTLICNDFQMISDYAIMNDVAFRMMKRVLPGPYTFILPATSILPKLILTKRKTVGVRIPDNAFCNKIINAINQPLISTSVTTISGDLFETATDIENEFGHLLDFVIDTGETLYQRTTVVDLSTKNPSIIREGLGSIDPFVG